MTCPKCNEENLGDSNFCRFCSNPLKEKCPECGEMEWIGREVCEELVWEINYELFQHTGKAAPDYIGLGVIIAASSGIPFIISLIADKLLPNSSIVAWIGIVSIGIFAISMPVGAILEFTLGSWQKEKAKQEFFRLHPEYAEILKNAKSADAESFGGQEEE